MSYILKLPEVKKATALSRSSIYRYIQQGSFPQPVSLGTRAVGWLASEVNDWIATRVSQRGGTNE